MTTNDNIKKSLLMFRTQSTVAPNTLVALSQQLELTSFANVSERAHIANPRHAQSKEIY